MPIFLIWNAVLVFNCLFLFWKPAEYGFQSGNIRKEGKTLLQVSFPVMLVFFLGAVLVLNLVFKGNPYRDSGFEPVIMSPILEETFFRGMIFYLTGRLLEKWNWKGKPFVIILINAILFGCVHFLNLFDSSMDLTFVLIQVSVNIALGIFYTYLRWKSDSIYPSMFVHFLWNFLNTKI